MAGDGADGVAVAEAHYWTMRCIAAGPRAAGAEADGLVRQAWVDAAAARADDGGGRPLHEAAAGALLRRVRDLEAGSARDPHGRAVAPSWFNPSSHRWAGWWDREPAAFDRLDVDDDATRSAAERALAELPLAARAVLVLHDVTPWPPDAVRSVVRLQPDDHLALLHAARSHVRRALERLVDEVAPPPVAGDAATAPGLTEYDISCDRVTGLATRYLEGAIEPRLRTTFEEHLVVCPPCVCHVAQLRVTVRALHALAGRPVPPPVRAELAAALSPA